MTQDLRFVTLLVMHRVRDPLDKKGISRRLAWGGEAVAGLQICKPCCSVEVSVIGI